MERFKNILVATDLEATSLGVVSYAAHLLPVEGGELGIVHVAPTVSLGDYAGFVPAHDLDDVDRDLLAHARMTLEEWVHRHVKTTARVNITVEQGVIYEVVCRVAEEMNADVLVVGSHGRDGLSRLVLGSTAEKLMRHAPCPVLVVRPPEPSKQDPKADDDAAADANPSTNGVTA